MAFSHSKIFTSLMLIGFLGAPYEAIASTTDFNQIYSDYQTSVKTDDTARTVQLAQQAYDLGKVKFEDKMDIANLQLNLANALDADAKVSPENKGNISKAVALYELALVTYKEKYGENAIELIDPLLGLALTSQDKVSHQYFDRIISIAESNKKPKTVAFLKMSAFDKLANSTVSARIIKNYAFEAYEFYENNFPENSAERLKASLNIAMIYYSEKKYDQAIPLYENLVEQYKVLDFDHPFKLASHARLVELYENQNQSEKSTAHCIAIGSLKPWSDTQEQIPLFRKEPNYPTIAVKRMKSGSVDIEFTVDEAGFVKDPNIIKTVGSSAFEKTSLEALKKWRYAPKFVDGKAVEAQTMVRIEYHIES